MSSDAASTSKGSMPLLTTTASPELENGEVAIISKAQQRLQQRERSATVSSYHSVASIVQVVRALDTEHTCHEQEYQDVPGRPPVPDGGYGWVVVLASFLSFCTISFQFGASFVLYVSLAEYFQADRGVIGWIASLYGFTGSFFGIVIGAYVKRYDCRIVGIFGGLICCTGIALSSLLVNVPYLYVTYGLVGGLGNGIVFISSQVIVQQYFDKRRALAVGISNTGLSFGSLCAVPIVNEILKIYSLSGTYLLLAGLALQSVWMAALYRPLRDPKRTSDTTSSHRSSGSVLVEGVKSQLTHNPDPGSSIEVILSNTEAQKNGGTETQIKFDTAEEDSSQKRRPASDNASDNSPPASSLKNLLVDIVDFAPLKAPPFALYFVANFLYNVGAISFFVHYFSRLIFLGVPRSMAIGFQMLLSSSTWLGRLIFSIIGNLPKINRVLAYAILVTLGGAIVTTFSLTHTPIPLAIYGALHGFTAGCYFSLQPTVMVDVSGIDMIPKKTGLITMMISAGSLIGTPLAGFVFDVTGNYDYPYLVIGGIQIVGGVMLLVVAVMYTRNRRRNKVND